MLLSTLFKHWGIALTGGIASGKSTVAGFLRKEGLLVFDADEFSRNIVIPGSPALAEIAKVFGPELLRADGSLDRPRMRQLIFSDSKQRQTLEAIIHPRLNDEAMRMLTEAGLIQNPQIWFYEAALIFERQRTNDFREVWVAYCDEAKQIERLMLRDHCSHAQAQAILQAQMPASKKAAEADVILDTSCSIGELQDKVKAAVQELKQRFKAP
ncbi:MAG: dephospho-CoA kinase [Proteobacteria bacterium]|nr:dephospho-CoA kinase [Pseudomonadota bacterium]